MSDQHLRSLEAKVLGGDKRALNFQARFCTRCWKAIEVCRAIESKWKAAKK